MKTSDIAQRIGRFSSAPLEPGRAARIRAAILKAPLPLPAVRVPRVRSTGTLVIASTLALVTGVGVWLAVREPAAPQSCVPAAVPSVASTKITASASDTAGADASIAAPAYAVRGVVCMPNGESPGNVPLWVEEVTGARPNNFVLELNTPIYAVAGTFTRTDAAGRFTIATLASTNHFVVKAVPRAYPPAISAVLDARMLTADNVTITVSDFGGRITGNLTGPAGEAVTNVSLVYYLDKTHVVKQDEEIWLAVDVTPDGQYISQVLRPGWYQLMYRPDNLTANSCQVLVRNGALEVVNMQFKQTDNINGEVRDVTTGKVVPGVRVQDGQETLAITDKEGRFHTRAHSECTFSHPAYGTLQCGFRSYETTTERFIVWLSPRAEVAVTVLKYDGTPATNVVVIVEMCTDDKANLENALGTGPLYYNPYYFVRLACDRQGYALVTNVPALYFPMRAKIMAAGSMFEIIGESPLFTVRPGARTEMVITLPPSAPLFVRFATAVDLDLVSVRCGNIARDDFVPDNGALVCQYAPTGVCSMSVSGVGVATTVTNLLLRAGQQTDFLVATDAALCGVIQGTVCDRMHTPVPCFVSACITGSTTTVATDEAGDKCGQTRTRPFLLTGLDPQARYDVKINILTTNLVVRDVAPNGPPLEVMVNGYRVTANLISRNGEIACAQVDLYNVGFGMRYEGEFTIFPVTPGTYQLVLECDRIGRHENPPRMSRAVTVVDRDVDLGDIVVDDPGVAACGKLVDAVGNPMAGCVVTLHAQPANALNYFGYIANAKTGDDGTFRFTGVVRGEALTLDVNSPTQCVTKAVGVLSADTDLGSLRVMQQP